LEERGERGEDMVYFVEGRIWCILWRGGYGVFCGGKGAQNAVCHCNNKIQCVILLEERSYFISICGYGLVGGKLVR
jgi:hypothetical protein